MASNIITHRTVVLLLLIGVVNCKYNSWEEYINAWNKVPESDRMYPYGTDFFDEEHSGRGTDGEDANIGFYVKYFGSRYKSAFVSIDGHIELSNTRPAENTHKDPNQKWPNENYPHSSDPPIISPYFAHFDMGSWEDDPGRIYLRTLEIEKEEDPAGQEITSGMLDLLSAEVRTHVLGGWEFRATHGLVATWENITFYGCIREPCPTNTLQAAIIIDEKNTYVLYNYYKITWAGSSRQHCDPATGNRTEGYPDCFPGQAGFNAGKGREFMPLPYSNTDDVVNLDQESGTGVQGRFIYAVHKRAQPCGCTNNTNINQDIWPLDIWPSYGPMFGGHAVYFSGPCFFPEQHIRCRFGTKEVDGYRVENNMARAVCIAPMLNEIGQISVFLSINGGANYPYTAKYYVTLEDRIPPKVHLENDDGQWFTTKPSELRMTWSPGDLTWPHDEHSGSDLFVDIRLMGYAERDIEDDELGNKEVVWEELTKLAEDRQNAGYFTFHPEMHSCVVDCDWGVTPPVGAVAISVVNPSIPLNRTIWSYPVPFGWYMDTIMVDDFGLDWVEKKCKEWADQQKPDLGWTDGLSPCPLTAEHAWAEIGRFHGDFECEDDMPRCPRKEKFIYCSDGVMPAIENELIRCCYGLDGHLRHMSDVINGSSSSRASRMGAVPYGKPPKIPTMSHWYNDLYYWFLCCKWTSKPEYCFDHYAGSRPTPYMTDYQPAKHAIAFGDPHFQTFDGTEYSFNGRGEFWLLRVRVLEGNDNFNLQGRFERPEEAIVGGHNINATVLTSIVMQEGDAQDMRVPKVEIQMTTDDSDKMLLILVNGVVQDFGHPETMVREIADSDKTRLVVIRNTDPVDANDQSSFTVAFKNGVGVHVTRRKLMDVTVAVPPSYYDKTEGLFGTWNDDPFDDLVTPAGVPIDPYSSNEVIHYDFGMEWDVSQTDTRFTYVASKTWSYYRDPNFTPNFEEPQLPIEPPYNITEDDVTELCDDNFVCRYDYKTMYDADIALMSMVAQNHFYHVANATVPVATCGRLDFANSIREYDHYLAGGRVEVVGCQEGYTLRGRETIYNCEDEHDNTASWQPALDTECKDNDEIAQENAILITAIVVPILFILLFAAIGLYGYMVYKKKKEKKMLEENIREFKETPSETALAENNPDFNMAQSRISVNSNGSIILTQELHPARPPRPKRITSTASYDPTTEPNPITAPDQDGSSSTPGENGPGQVDPTNSSTTPYYIGMDPYGMVNQSFDRQDNIEHGSPLIDMHIPVSSSRDDLRGATQLSRSRDQVDGYQSAHDLRGATQLSRSRDPVNGYQSAATPQEQRPASAMQFYDNRAMEGNAGYTQRHSSISGATTSLTGSCTSVPSLTQYAGHINV